LGCRRAGDAQRRGGDFNLGSVPGDLGGVPEGMPVPRVDGGVAGERGPEAGAGDRDRHAGDDAGLRAVRPGSDAAARLRAAAGRRAIARATRSRGVPVHDDPARPPQGPVRQQGVHRFRRAAQGARVW